MSHEVGHYNFLSVPEAAEEEGDHLSPAAEGVGAAFLAEEEGELAKKRWRVRGEAVVLTPYAVAPREKARALKYAAAVGEEEHRNWQLEVAVELLKRKVELRNFWEEGVGPASAAAAAAKDTVLFEVFEVQEAYAAAAWEVGVPRVGDAAVGAAAAEEEAFQDQEVQVGQEDLDETFQDQEVQAGQEDQERLLYLQSLNWGR